MSLENEVRDFAENFYEELDQTHGLEHLERTLEIAEFLAEEEGAEKEIVRLGAMLHQLHDEERTEEFLEALDIEEEKKNQVVDCVRCSELEEIERCGSLEARVVFDADKLQVVGPFGTIREIACDAGARDRNFREALKHTRRIEEECFEKIQTDTGRRIAKRHHEIMEDFWNLLDEMDNAEFR